MRKETGSEKERPGAVATASVEGGASRGEASQL